MKIGSLVELVDDNWRKYDSVYPIKGKVYTVREIVHYDDTGILLEEILNNIKEYPKWGNVEAGFLISRFRELQAPSSISIESFIKETV